MAASSSKELRWHALESSPEGFNKWSSSLGLDTNVWAFADVFGLDPELLEWVKQPVKAVLMLFPITEAYEKMRLAKDKEIEEDGVEEVEDVVFFKQTIANACGTMGLLHALANCGVPLQKDSPLTDLFARCKDKSPFERAELLASNDDLERVHTETAHTGQTATPDLDAQVDLHFVTFVEHKGNLIELDGRRNSPVNHGKIEVGLLEDTVEVVKRVIAISNSVNFNLVTLGPAPTDD